MLGAYEEIYIMKVVMAGFPPPVSKLYYHWDQGLEKHGDKYLLLSNLKTIPTEVNSFYQTNLLKPKHTSKGRTETQGIYYQYILDSKQPFIVSESNPFRKYDGWTRFAWWSYKWTDANCNNDNVGPERWNKFEKSTRITIKDWNSPGNNILIMGQKENDSSLISLYEKYDSFWDWVLEVITTVRKYSDRPIVIRPHPRNANRGIREIKQRILTLNLKDVDITENISHGVNQGGKPLDKDLSNAYCVITYNSLSAVEAVCEGIPTFALDNGSMAWPIAHKELSQIENLNYNIDLQEWKNKIAYTMWNKQEVSSGECWAHLKPVYFK
jgi:hypothetical protein